ncbi:MAG: RDD family protein [Candidatus Cloacimonetes bacterium]|nr:RDD family protein [Candidatus Cloacimonadota bacterium]
MLEEKGGFWMFTRWLIATIIDIFIISVITIGILTAVELVMGEDFIKHLDSEAEPEIMGIFSLIVFIIFWLLKDGLFKGRGPGKFLMRLRYVSLSTGEGLTFYTNMLRSTLNIITSPFWLLKLSWYGFLMFGGIILMFGFRIGNRSIRGYNPNLMRGYFNLLFNPWFNMGTHLLEYGLVTESDFRLYGKDISFVNNTEEELDKNIEEKNEEKSSETTIIKENQNEDINWFDENDKN